MDALTETINRVILDPHNKDVLAIIKGLRNGLVYGAKVRFPHALVMTVLFRSGSFREKIKTVLTATRQHATNLAAFVTIYKTTMYLLSHQRSTSASPAPANTSPKESSADPFLAGLIGGYLVFGRGSPSNVNQQIVLYVFARVILGLAKLSITPESKLGVIPNPGGWTETRAWPVFASLSWGGVMWLFRYYPEALQPSLKASMDYLYVNSDTWDSFRNFLVHNQ